jgi:hypothetical protein
VQQTTRVLKDLVFVQTLKEKKEEIFEDSQMSEQRQILSILILINLCSALPCASPFGKHSSHAHVVPRHVRALRRRRRHPHWRRTPTRVSVGHARRHEWAKNTLQNVAKDDGDDDEKTKNKGVAPLYAVDCQPEWLMHRINYIYSFTASCFRLFFTFIKNFKPEECHNVI